MLLSLILDGTLPTWYRVKFALFLFVLHRDKTRLIDFVINIDPDQMAALQWFEKDLNCFLCASMTKWQATKALIRLCRYIDLS